MFRGTQTGEYRIEFAAFVNGILRASVAGSDFLDFASGNGIHGLADVLNVVGHVRVSPPINFVLFFRSPKTVLQTVTNSRQYPYRLRFQSAFRRQGKADRLWPDRTYVL